MKEEKGSFNIKNQKAKRDIVNVAVDIIQHPITKEPVYIPTIQSVLRKEETPEGDFFKKEPEWVDYEQGFIVERKEVNEIINSLENDKIQLVLGKPASGKSTILKNVGYKLANEDKKVYVIELKKHQRDEVKLLLDYIPKIDDNEPIFIVDDAHLDLSDCERLIRNFKRSGKGKLIIGSRETKEITEEHPKEGAEYELLSELSETCMHVQAEGITEEMIRTFLENQYHFDEDKIKSVSSNLIKYKNDLWLLSWALKTYNKDKESVDIDEIYEKIVVSIKKIKVGKNKESINAEDVFLPLSIFYRYEIPIQRYFLEEQLDIKEEALNRLIGLQEIVETKDTMLSLHHSSIAELYLGAYLNKSHLGRGIKKKILNGKNEKELEFCLFYRYLIKSDSRNVVDAIIYLGSDLEDKKGGKTLLKNLSEREKIQKSIEIGIEREDNIGKIGKCLFVITRASGKIASYLVETIDINGLSAKMEKELDALMNGTCLAGISIASKESGMKLISIVVSKIDKEEDIEKIGSCVSSIAFVSQEVALKLVEKINIDYLSLKIYNEEDVEKVSWCVTHIARVSKEVALKLVDSISSKRYQEEDIGKVGSCVAIIARISKEVALKLVDSVSSKIDEEKDIVKVGLCVFIIAGASQEVALKLVDSVSSKIYQEADIGKVGSCVFIIAGASQEVALKLVDSVSSKIDKEADIGKVGSCVFYIARASQEVALKLVDSVSSKIDKEADIGKVGSCVFYIARASQEVALKLVDNVSSKIDKEEDIEKVGSCVFYIARASQEVALKLVDNVSSKIDKEEDIEKVGWCVSNIATASQEVALKLVDSVSSKIDQEADIGKVGSCVSIIAMASQEVANEIINRSNPKQREELQKRMSKL